MKAQSDHDQHNQHEATADGGARFLAPGEIAGGAELAVDTAQRVARRRAGILKGFADLLAVYRETEDVVLRAACDQLASELKEMAKEAKRAVSPTRSARRAKAPGAAAAAGNLVVDGSREREREQDGPVVPVAPDVMEPDYMDRQTAARRAGSGEVKGGVLAWLGWGAKK